jgi:hypothetical protein
LKVETGNLEGVSQLCARSRNYFFRPFDGPINGRGFSQSKFPVSSFKFHFANR